MKHLISINDIEQTLSDHRLCLFYIKAPDCGVCNVMLDKVELIADLHTTEFRMMLTLMVQLMDELPEGSVIVFLTNAAYIQNFAMNPDPSLRIRI